MPTFSISERFLHPEGVFPAQLVEWREESGQFGPQIKWIFETNETQEDGEQAKMSYWTGTKFSSDPRAKLPKLCQALGVPVPVTKEEAEAFDPEKLVGKVCRVRVIHQPGRDGTDWANIDSLIPNSRTARAAAAPSPPTGDAVPGDPFADES